MIDDTPAAYARQSGTADTPGPTFEIGTFNAGGGAINMSFNIAVFC